MQRGRGKKHRLPRVPCGGAPLFDAPVPAAMTSKSAPNARPLGKATSFGKALLGNISSKERRELRDRLRLAILAGDAATVDAVLSDDRFVPSKDLCKPDQNGRTPLLNAAFTYQLDFMARFLDLGAEGPVAEKETGNTPLHYLCKVREPAASDTRTTLESVMTTLLRSGCPANAVDQNGCTALHYAARSANLIALDALLQHGATVNCKNLTGETPLYCCVSARSVCWGEAALSLLLAKADPRVPDASGVTAFDLVQSYQLLEGTREIDVWRKMQQVSFCPRVSSLSHTPVLFQLNEKAGTERHSFSEKHSSLFDAVATDSTLSPSRSPPSTDRCVCVRALPSFSCGLTR